MTKPVSMPGKQAKVLRGGNHAGGLFQLIIGIGIVAVLISLLMPVIERASQTAKQVSCVGNLKQIHTAVSQYSLDHNAFLPAYCEVVKDKPNLYWLSKLRPYLNQPVTKQWADNDPAPKKLYRCPSDKRVEGAFNGQNMELNGSYGLCGLNGLLWGVWAYSDGTRYSWTEGFSRASVLKPAQTVMLFDHDQIYASGPNELRDSRHAFRHQQRINVIYFDGHASAFSKESIPNSLDVFWGKRE